MPKAKREAMYTLYAFCRHIDDIVDGDSSLAEKQELLQAWREEMDNIYDKKVPATEIGRRSLVILRADESPAELEKKFHCKLRKLFENVNHGVYQVE